MPDEELFYKYNKLPVRIMSILTDSTKDFQYPLYKHCGRGHSTSFKEAKDEILWPTFHKRNRWNINMCI